MAYEVHINNIDKPVIEVNHKDLKRSSKDSPFRSKCPVCKQGVLLLRIDRKKHKFIAKDICICCGQRVKYKDIKELNKMLK